MNDGYYDYQPTHQLSKALVLISFVNELTRAVASSLASTTGLPLRLLDDVVEHYLGASSVELVDHSGLVAWRDAEKAQLATTVRSRPQAVVALGDGAIDEDDSRKIVLEESELVYLYLSVDEAQIRFNRQSIHRKATSLAELQRHGGGLDDGLRRLYRQRCHAYERAHRSLDARGKSTVALSNELSAMLDG